MIYPEIVCVMNAHLNPKMSFLIALLIWHGMAVSVFMLCILFVVHTIFLSLCVTEPGTMPTWNQIQSQLKHPNNPVVFFDIKVGNTVSNAM